MIVTSPDGGESWAGGTAYNITWTTIDINKDIADIEYSSDGGSTWNSIASGVGDTGSYSWTVPSIDVPTAKVRVTATDKAGNSTSDESDADFTIDSTAPVVTITDIADSVNSLGQISGTASDSSGIDKLQVVVKNTTDNTYWDGSSWVATETWLDATGTISWSYATPTLSDSKAYLVKAKAIDKAGNTSALGLDSFTFYETPTAAFAATPTSGNEPLTVQFTDQCTGTVNSWAWDFGDGETSNERNPSHTYASSGTYTLTLTVAGLGGTDTLTDIDCITVTAPPSPGPLGLPPWVWAAIVGAGVLLFLVILFRLTRKR